MKVIFRNIHLYLSLAAGLVIMTCCFTGAVLVFEKELQEAFNHDRYFVTEKEILSPLQQLADGVKKHYSSAKITSLKVYPDPQRSVEIGITMPADKKENTADRTSERQVGAAASSPAAAGAKPTGPGGGNNYTAFVNPYTGKVLELYSYRETFFYSMFALHRWLLGGSDSIGKTITGVATFIFLFILITGIILWWPRNRAILMKRLKIKTNASWKRINHDLHIVLGFYASIFLFIFAFTALAWSFKWFNNAIYTVTGSSMKSVEPPRSTYTSGSNFVNYDSAYIAVMKAAGSARYYTLRAPADTTAPFTVSVLPMGVHESATDNYYVDQYTGAIIGTQKFSERNLGQRIRSTFKPVHTGSIYGLPSKIVAFIVCVLGVTFPVTGTIMWLKRLSKNRKRKAAGKPVVVEEEEYQ